jgi:hypothetical protein
MEPPETPGRFTRRTATSGGNDLDLVPGEVVSAVVCHRGGWLAPGHDAETGPGEG